jgi:hypothetical protein
MDQLLSNPRAHAHHIERTAVHRMPADWLHRYAATERAAPRYDPVQRKAATNVNPINSVIGKAADPGRTYRRSHEPTDPQRRAGNDRKRKLDIQGLTIAVETEAGGVRRGVNKADGHA